MTLVGHLKEGRKGARFEYEPEPSSYPGLAESEAWALAVAGYAARCSRAALLSLQDAPPTLVVERYDRIGSDWPNDIQRWCLLPAMQIHRPCPLNSGQD